MVSSQHLMLSPKRPKTQIPYVLLGVCVGGGGGGKVLSQLLMLGGRGGGGG